VSCSGWAQAADEARGSASVGPAGGEEHGGLSRLGQVSLLSGRNGGIRTILTDQRHEVFEAGPMIILSGGRSSSRTASIGRPPSGDRRGIAPRSRGRVVADTTGGGCSRA
jgi:hypothetical protein